MAGRRMSHDDRHLQLLDTAAAIVRSAGADALTLARVAEAAGVTKPIVYQHFETRTGLLRALYRRVDDQQTDAARTALAAKAHTLEEAVAILARAYVDCVLHIGQEFGGITAALSASAELETVLRAGRQGYVELYLGGLKRFAPLSGKDRTVLLGVIGAAETLAREAVAGRLSRAKAVDAISRIMLAAVRGGSRRARSA